MNTVEGHKNCLSNVWCYRSTAAATLLAGITVVALSAMMLYALNNPSCKMSCLVCRLGDQGNAVASTLLIVGVAVTALGLTLVFTDPCFEKKLEKQEAKATKDLYCPLPLEEKEYSQVRPVIAKIEEGCSTYLTTLFKEETPLLFKHIPEEKRPEAIWIQKYYDRAKEQHLYLKTVAASFLKETETKKGLVNKADQKALQEIQALQRKALISMGEWTVIVGLLQLGTPPNEVLSKLHSRNPL
jgi:hypothetical protein